MDTLYNLSNASDSDGCDINATIAIHSHWIYESFGDCVVNVRQYIAVTIGIISLLAWIVAQLPQIVENCRTGEADKALSFWFLILWVVSDSTNLLGAILTNQLITQIVVSAYFVVIDLISLVQYLHHYFRNQGLRGLKKSCRLKRNYGTVVLNMAVFILVLPSVGFFLTSSQEPYHDSSTRRGRNLLGVDDPIIDVHDKRFISGYILGWISAVVYFFALPPQIFKNFMRSSAEGVSLLFIVFVTIGDSTYVTNVLLFSVEKVHVIRSLPWIAGRGWSLFFDVVLLIQVIMYKSIAHFKSKNTDSKDTDSKEVEGITDEKYASIRVVKHHSTSVIYYNP